MARLVFNPFTGKLDYVGDGAAAFNYFVPTNTYLEFGGTVSAPNFSVAYSTIQGPTSAVVTVPSKDSFLQIMTEGQKIYDKLGLSGISGFVTWPFVIIQGSTANAQNEFFYITSNIDGGGSNRTFSISGSDGDDITGGSMYKTNDNGVKLKFTSGRGGSLTTGGNGGDLYFEASQPGGSGSHDGSAILFNTHAAINGGTNRGFYWSGAGDYNFNAAGKFKYTGGSNVIWQLSGNYFVLEDTTSGHSLYLQSNISTSNITNSSGSLDLVNSGNSYFSFTQAAATTGTPSSLLRVIGAMHTGVSSTADFADVRFEFARDITLVSGGSTSTQFYSVTIQAPNYKIPTGSLTMTGDITTVSIARPAIGTGITANRTYSILCDGPIKANESIEFKFPYLGTFTGSKYLVGISTQGLEVRSGDWNTGVKLTAWDTSGTTNVMMLNVRRFGGYTGISPDTNGIGLWFDTVVSGTDAVDHIYQFGWNSSSILRIKAQGDGAGGVVGHTFHINEANVALDFELRSVNNTDLISSKGSVDTLALGTAAPTNSTDSRLTISFPTFVAAVGATVANITINSKVTEAASSNHRVLAGTEFKATSIFNGSATTDIGATVYISGAASGISPVEGLYGLYVNTAAVRVDSSDIVVNTGGENNTLLIKTSTSQISFGNATDTSTKYYFSGNSFLPPVNQNGYWLRLEPKLTEQSSGTHALMHGVYIDALAVANAGASTTNASSFFVQGNASGTFSGRGYAAYINGSVFFGGGQRWLLTTVNASTFSATIEQTILHVTYTSTGAVTINLPAAASAGLGAILIVKDAFGLAATNNITLDGNASETIDGSTTYVISINYGAVTLYCDGANWFVI